MIKTFSYRNIKTLLSFLTVPFTHPYASKNILKAFIRIIRWQILSRQKTEIIETWVNDLKVICRNGDTGFTGNLYYGLMEYHDMSFVMHLLDSSDTFVDIGSNLGSYTLLAGGVCQSSTYSLEPSPSTFKRLKANVKLNNIEKIYCLNIGAGIENGSFYMTESKGPENHVTTEISNDTVKVDVKKIDDINFDSNPTFIKIDTEGTEFDVIRGGLKVLDSPEMIGLLVEINGNNQRYNQKTNEMIQFLNNLGYHAYRYDYSNKELHKINHIKTNGNTLFIKNYLKASQKIKDYKSNQLWGKDI